MADSANRIYHVFKATPKDTSSKLVAFTVVSLNPMKLSDGDKLVLPVEFFVFSKQIDKTKISVGDKFLSTSVNGMQFYYIQDVISSTNKVYKYDNNIEDLQTEVNSLKSRVSSLEQRVTALEARI